MERGYLHLDADLSNGRVVVDRVIVVVLVPRGVLRVGEGLLDRRQATDGGRAIVQRIGGVAHARLVPSHGRTRAGIGAVLLATQYCTGWRMRMAIDQ